MNQIFDDLILMSQILDEPILMNPIFDEHRPLSRIFNEHGSMNWNFQGEVENGIPKEPQKWRTGILSEQELEPGFLTNRKNEPGFLMNRDFYWTGIFIEQFAIAHRLNYEFAIAQHRLNYECSSASLSSLIRRRPTDFAFADKITVIQRSLKWALMFV